MHQENNFFSFRLCFKDILKDKNENALEAMKGLKKRKSLSVFKEFCNIYLTISEETNTKYGIGLS